MAQTSRSLASRGTKSSSSAGLEFLWLELTNRCNLKCVHCYTESSPQTGDRDLSTVDDYLSVMNQAYALGCRQLQFIGGEPLLNPDFQRLLESSKRIGFQFVEVFTNLTRLDEDTVRFAREADIRFATSVYSNRPEVHQAITQNRSSHARTIGNLKRLIANGIVTRAAVIQIDQAPGEVETTKRFLTDLGVQHVRSSYVRAFGRGEEVRSEVAQLSELCGHCWAGRLCVAPDGEVYPCVMARRWGVGNVREATLSAIVQGAPLGQIRRTIHDTVWLAKAATARQRDDHADGRPGQSGAPSGPTLTECPQSCEPDGECPQSCTPTCDPADGVCPKANRKCFQPKTQHGKNARRAASRTASAHRVARRLAIQRTDASRKASRSLSRPTEATTARQCFRSIKWLLTVHPSRTTVAEEGNWLLRGGSDGE